MEKNITVMPVSASGIGSWMIVNIDGTEYKSTPTQSEFDYTTMDNAMEEIYTAVSDEDREAVELKYYSLKDAMKAAEEEEAYRAAHPEEFIMQEYDNIEPAEEINDTTAPTVDTTNVSEAA